MNKLFSLTLLASAIALNGAAVGQSVLGSWLRAVTPNALLLPKGGGTSTSRAPVATPSALPIDLDMFKANLQAEFNGKFVGWAFAVARNGKVRRAGAGGFARLPDDGNKPMSSWTRQNVASVTKTITAIAVLQLLEKNGLTLATHIAPYLPADWPRGYGFQNGNSLTFKQLLTHKSGLNQRYKGMTQAQKDIWGNDWDGLKYIVEKGVKAKDVGTWGYKNANYALFRIIILLKEVKS